MLNQIRPLMLVLHPIGTISSGMGRLVPTGATATDAAAQMRANDIHRVVPVVAEVPAPELG